MRIIIWLLLVSQLACNAQPSHIPVIGQGNRIVALPSKAGIKYVLPIIGQSNAEGIDPHNVLPPSLTKEFQNVYIWFNETEADGAGGWQKLKVGTNNQRSTAAAGSNRLQWFGMELAIADLFEKNHPNDVLYIIKYAVGGAPVAQDASFVDWSSASTNEALDIFIEGYADPALATLSGYTRLPLVDMQGEQDASSPTQSVTATFRTNKANEYAEIRTRLGFSNWPIIVCRLNAAISRDPTQLANVRTAAGGTSLNLTDAATYPFNTMFDTDPFQLIPADPVHHQQYLFGRAIYTALGL
jgi:hypothetical protein